MNILKKIVSVLIDILFCGLVILGTVLVVGGIHAIRGIEFGTNAIILCVIIGIMLFCEFWNYRTKPNYHIQEATLFVTDKNAHKIIYKYQKRQLNEMIKIQRRINKLEQNSKLTQGE